MDFTYVGNKEKIIPFEKALQRACTLAEEEMSKYISQPKLIIEKYTEKQPHPEGQLAFIIRGQLPWHREPLVKVMVEITINENVLLPLVNKKIIHQYGESIDAILPVYSLEEIILEKLRAILQYSKKLHEQGWARSRVRDYYDLWHIFKNFNTEINYSLISNLLGAKCQGKDVNFSRSEDFFQPLTLLEAKKGWVEWLAPLVITMPEYEQVISDLREHTAKFFN